MTRFSANLGFLWTELSLPDAIRAAATAGFDAVECHWPYDVPVADVRAALRDTGLPMLGINTRRGDVTAGEMGLAALPGREGDARSSVDEALDYASAIGAANVHVLAGMAEGASAERAYRDTLGYACERAAKGGMAILIEPLNRHDAPGYFLCSTDQARTLIDSIAAPNLRLMFDCYHVGRTEGRVTERLRDLMPVIGHIQFASVPDRGPPDRGQLDYTQVFRTICDLGYDAPLGAEYKTGGATEPTLGWMARYRTKP